MDAAVIRSDMYSDLIGQISSKVWKARTTFAVERTTASRRYSGGFRPDVCERARI